MPLTTVTGSYKSGKTALLDDVYKHSKHLTYIRQGHKVRPDVKVCEIPNFDPSKLPFWDLYQSCGLANTVRVGGVLGAEYIPGLTGGQHKLLLLEMLYQHTLTQRKLSIALDEPLEMIPAESLPFVIDRVKRLRERHHVVISTCDHIQTLTKVSDITLGMNAFDTQTVKVNNREYVDREKAIMALSVFDRRAKHHMDESSSVDEAIVNTFEAPAREITPEHEPIVAAAALDSSSVAEPQEDEPSFMEFDVEPEPLDFELEPESTVAL